MATSSITKNFIVLGDEQVEMFADAIEASYQESLHKSKEMPSFTYKEVTSSSELNDLIEKWAL